MVTAARLPDLSLEKVMKGLAGEREKRDKQEQSAKELQAACVHGTLRPHILRVDLNVGAKAQIS